MSTSARYRLDVLGYLLAIAYAWPTLLYPYGRDQALYAYVAWGWMEGHLPYVDSFDQKPPGIYLLYGLGWLLFGPQTWAIRALELGALLWIGRAVGQLVARPDEPSLGSGAAALLVVGIHVTCFDFWHTGQLEVWEALFVLLAMVQARAGRPLRAGALSGLAFLFKFPSLLMILVVAAAALSTRRRVSTLAWFVGGALIPAVVVLPWVLTGHTRDLYDVLIVYNRAYLDKASAFLDARELWLDWAWPYTALLGALAMCGVVAAIRLRALGGGGWLLALLGAAVGTVAWQAKGYPYHWTVVPPFAVAVGMWGGARLAAWWPRLGRAPVGLALAAATVWIGLVTAPGWYRHQQWNYERYYPLAVQYARGRVRPQRFLNSFVSTHIGGFSAANIARISALIRAQRQPGDTLCMIGFDPDINNQTGMRCTSRFVSNFPIADAGLRYPMKRAWTAEYQRTFLEDPPTFLVYTQRKTRQVDQAVANGYQEIARAGRYVALRKP